MDEAPLKQTEGGLEPDGEGWFVVNTRDACWYRNEAFGWGTIFESREHRFPQLGINVSVLQPGQPGCMYHRESAQENFLVLSGECLLLVEGEERPLQAWDFVHCPPMTDHVFVGAGDGPCTIVAVGARFEEEEIVYPVAEVALKHGAGVPEETPDPAVAYAPYPRSEQARPDHTGLPWDDA